jgi:hypothetical protein
MNLKHIAEQIVQFHHDAIVRWKSDGVQTSQYDLMAAVEQNHQHNYLLWHAEDRARRNDMGDAFVVQAKREIDKHNQARNNQMEAMDHYFIEHLKPASHTQCKVHSETPGMMIDRLSILALKIYHMRLQTERLDVDEQHRKQCLAKLNQLNLQHQQLTQCLSELLQDIEHQNKTFRIYQQHKMYNDPKLNPELYHPKNKENCQ